MINYPGGSARIVLFALAIVVFAVPGAAAAGSAAALTAQYAAMRDRLDSSPFGRPLHLESVESERTVKGDIHALIDHPFAAVRQALAEARSWCDILILHPNVKHCRYSEPGASAAGTGALLTVHLGRAEERATFAYRLAAEESDYFEVDLFAPAGPLGTSNHRIRVEAAALDPKRTLVRLAYSHDYGMQARFAMQAYLGTFGRGKVGFTVVGRDRDGRPVYVSELRGALERNAMRYFLAVEAYLESLSSPRAQQVEKRIRTWYAFTERYPLQLHEDGVYLENKRRESQRMRAAG